MFTIEKCRKLLGKSAIGKTDEEIRAMSEWLALLADQIIAIDKKQTIMNKNAILYTRVSTDEQNNGYSPADQKDKLIRHCEQKNINVVGFYHDDESGKSFDRPEWQKIMKCMY